MALFFAVAPPGAGQLFHAFIASIHALAHNAIPFAEYINSQIVQTPLVFIIPRQSGCSVTRERVSASETQQSA